MPRKSKRSMGQVQRWKRRAAIKQLLVVKEDVPPEQKDCSSIVEHKEPEPPTHIKEELWSSQEGEKFQGLEEADITKFPFTPVPVKSIDDEEEAQSSQLHQRQPQHMERQLSNSCDAASQYIKQETEVLDDDWKETREPQSASNSLKHDSRCKKTFSCSECGRRFGTRGHLYDHMRIHPKEEKYSCSVCNKRFIWRQQVRRHKCINLQSSHLHQSQIEENREADPPASRETQHMETEADGEDCGGPEPARNSHPDPLIQPETENQTGDSSDPETDDSADWKETREPQSASNSLKHDSRCKKTFSCSECGRRFDFMSDLQTHMMIHTEEKLFACSVCSRRFAHWLNLIQHMVIHTGEK